MKTEGCCVRIGLSLMAMLFASKIDVAHATEGGVVTWPSGINTVFPGVNPAPGTTMFYNYDAYYSASEVTNSRGKSALPGVEINVFASAARFLHTWNVDLGPFTITSGGAATFLHNSTDLGGLGHGIATGVSSVLLEPAYLNYASSDKKLFLNLGLLLNLSTGAYSTGKLVNLGTNVWTLSPIVDVTYFATPRLNFSLTTEADIYGNNSATNYQSGTTLTIDYAAMVSPFSSMPNLYVGPQGYFTNQLVDDSIGGQTYNDGNRLTRFAIGPQIVYLFKRDVGIALKWDHEVLAKNTSKGDKVWFQLAFPI